MRNGRNICIYMSDYNLYCSLDKEVRELYYKKYGQALSKSEVINKGLAVLKDTLTKSENLSELPKYSRIFK